MAAFTAAPQDTEPGAKQALTKSVLNENVDSLINDALK